MLCFICRQSHAPQEHMEKILGQNGTNWDKMVILGQIRKLGYIWVRLGHYLLTNPKFHLYIWELIKYYYIES